MALDPTHSSVSPACCGVCAQPCHACAHSSSYSLIPVFTLFFALRVSVRTISTAPGKKMDVYCFTADIFSYMCHIYSWGNSPSYCIFLLASLTRVSLSYGLIFLLLISEMLLLSSLMAVCLSAAKTSESLITQVGITSVIWSLCVCFFDRECTSCQLCMIFRYGSQLLHLISLAQPPDASANASWQLSSELLSTFNAMWPYNEHASFTRYQISHPSQENRVMGVVKNTGRTLNREKVG